MEHADSDRIKKLKSLLDGKENALPLTSLSSLVLDSFFPRFWNNLPDGEIIAALKEYTSFIADGLPYVECDGCRTCSPKVRVWNSSPGKGKARPLLSNKTVVEIHEINRPFIYESIRGYFTKKGFRIIGAIHPVFSVRREGGLVREFRPFGKEEKELFVVLYLEKIGDPAEIKRIESDLFAILRCLAFSVDDFERMKERIEMLARGVETLSVKGSKYSGSEVADFLRWLAADNFVVIGMREYLSRSGKEGRELKPLPDSDLGIFRDNSLPEQVVPGLMGEVEDILRVRAETPRIISTDFCRFGGAIIYQLSTVEFFSIRTPGQAGDEVKEIVLLGRLTRGAMSYRNDAIPFLRQKAKGIADAIEQGPSSFEYREARALFNYIPKQELFYATQVHLKATIKEIMAAESDDEVNVYARMGDGGRYAMVMVSISRNDNNYSVRKAIEKLLASTYDCPLTLWHHSSTETRALLFYYFSAPGEAFQRHSAGMVAEKIRAVALGWDQRFYIVLSDAFDLKAQPLFNRYLPSMETVYKDSTPPEKAVADIVKMEALLKNGPLQMALEEKGKGTAVLKLYALEAVPLMKILKELENFGLYVTGEQVFRFPEVADRAECFLYNYILSDEPGRIGKLNALLPDFFDAMVAVRAGRSEDDCLNRLLIIEGFGWRSLELVRTLKNYLLQINRAYNNSTVMDTIVRYSSVIRLIHDYFFLRFNPARMSKKERTARSLQLEEEIGVAINDIHGLSDFQVFSTLFEIVKQTVRTNFFCRPENGVLSIKVASREISALPLPKPMAEIYVHSPAFEGVHLRGGLVSRGGLRWSDRGDDFRTEILGLMKTQMLKNSIIVPEGAKGGFYIKKTDFPSRKAQLNHMKICYRAFIGALLQLTDNHVAEEKVFPSGTVRYDGFDPYLVVAADKGTAALSDTANEISLSHNFWLGDAFASGGATGYDHKKEGITARGVWESVKRHFREKGVDVQFDSITVVGIGDMSGDVFGNGTLLSDKILLVGAFNHMHIFLDPAPDPAKSFNERKRLFVLPRSTWADYDKKLISKGGGVYLRSAKAVPVSSEMACLLCTEKKEVSGEEMVRMLLRANVDLLYNGGIGTYVKAKGESHLDVGDKANDAVRVNGRDLRAKVVGEGGNLGMTQLGRLEYAARAGLCYTDAVDNSAGVNISDHEVNLKVMLDHLLEKGEIKSMDERNGILKEMTGEVCLKVLKNNYLQGGAISMDALWAKENPEAFVDVIDEMEKTLGLNRAEEFILPKTEMMEALEKGEEVFTRPLIAVLTGYQKMIYYKTILDSTMIDTVFVQRYLRDYFPGQVRRTFEADLPEHRLKREIISTTIINRVVNRAGITLLPLLSADTGRPVEDIAKAYIIIEGLLHADSFREEVYALDNIVPTALQYRYLMTLEEVIAYALRWFITHQTEDRISFDFVLQYGDIVRTFQEGLWDSIDETCRAEKKVELEAFVEMHVAEKVPEALAVKFAILPFLKDVMDIIHVKEEHHYNFYETARLYLKVVDFFHIDWIGESLGSLKAADKWGAENLANLKHELKDYQNGIVVSVLNFKRKSENLIEAFDHYIQEKRDEADVYSLCMDEIRSEGKVGIISLNVVIKKLTLFIAHAEGEPL